ncbi:dihydrolipoamide acetyltransferase family protein [Neobacillus niacini]|uniref:dihydrolipoamide acetyltransferase family protein n=1 Tax=Neobacillus niacini TaxID=86668 RepID=UPI003B02CAD4
MAVKIEMPKLSLTMSEGTVLHWMKKVGDPVKKGDAIVEVSSDKEVCELDAPEDGVLLDVTAKEGESVACHTVLAYIGQPAETVQVKETSSEAANNGNHIEAARDSNPSSRTITSSPSEKVKISPVARKMATEAGLDIQSIVGTGPNGRISKEDIEKAIQEAGNREEKRETPVLESAIKEAVSVENSEKRPVIGMRKVIAKRMQESLQQSAQLTHHMKADITELLSLKKKTALLVEKQHNTKYTLTDFIARAVVLSLQEHKQMNSAFIEEEIHIYNHIHLGIAAEVENGLVVPVVSHADSKSLVELSQSIKELSQLAKTKQLKSNQMRGSTFTISNLGSYGIEYFTPILNTPETGILGVGAAQETPVFVGDQVQKRILLPLSLTFNHQVLDGAPAAQFLQTLKNYLEEPIHLYL